MAVYLEAILGELARLFPDDEYRVFVPGSARADALPAAPNVSLVQARAPGPLVNGAAALARRPRLDRLMGGPDIVWAPAVAPFAVSAATPLVLTVHDLSFEHRPRDFSAYERVWHRLARPAATARSAARVIAVSEAVRAELLAEWNLAPERVRAVPHGPGRTPRAPSTVRDGERHVLAVGALEPRKLPGVLVEAHRRAHEQGLRADLVLAGDGPLRGELEQSGATVLGRVDDRRLDSLYAGALCVVCASREEGFGFTPLEGLAAGAPAVVSDLPAFAETLGDAALKIPPGDPHALADALLRLEREPGLRERLVAAGRERLAALSWERAARATRAAFDEALG